MPDLIAGNQDLVVLILMLNSICSLKQKFHRANPLVRRNKYAKTSDLYLDVLMESNLVQATSLRSLKVVLPISDYVDSLVL